MRVLITGDREWKNALKIRQVLTVLHTAHPDAILVVGGARGADSIAEIIGVELFGIGRVEVHPADWTKHGKAAGPIRNQFMIDESARRAEKDGHKLEYAVAFHSNLAQSKGTKDMVTRLESPKVRVPVLKIT